MARTDAANKPKYEYCGLLFLAISLMFMARRWHIYGQDRWCQERALTDLQWSPHRPELVLASYSARGHGLDATSSSSLHTDADGLVLVW